MIQLKCPDKTCGYFLTDEQIARGKKRKLKCPRCKKPLLRNITDPLDRKKWHCFLSKDKSIVEHAVLVVIDSFNDDSSDIEIPLLNMKFTEQDKFRGIHKASEEIQRELLNRDNVSYKSERRFITIAFKDESKPEKRNIPIGEMIFLDVNTSENPPSGIKQKPNPGIANASGAFQAKRKKKTSKDNQTRLF